MMLSFLRVLKSAKAQLATALILFSMVGASWEQCFATDAALAQNLPVSVSGPMAKQRILNAIAVQNRHTDHILRTPGVVGIGTGIGRDGQPVITIFSRIPGLAGMPQTLEGVPVTLKVTGMFIASNDPTVRVPRPVNIGVSTGHPNITAGTIGARVKDPMGNVYALSNNHVFADINNALIGDNILQPGVFDGGIDPTDKIAELFDFEVIDFSIFGSNTLDAAIAITTAAELGQSTLPGGYGMPNATIYGDMDADGFIDNINELLQLPVQKYGRTTGLTKGQISQINVTTAVCYANCDDLLLSQFAWFADQIAIVGNDAVAFSAGGDSGSLVLTDDPHKHPVALIFAGSDTNSLANRIDLVLDRFDVDIDGAAAEDICEADLDGDLDVDGYDLYLFQGYYPSDLNADLNNNGLVDSEDMDVFTNDFGRNDCP